MSRDRISLLNVLASLALCLSLSAQEKPAPASEGSQANSPVSDESKLAQAIVAADTDEKRDALANENKTLVTPALVLAAVSRAKELRSAKGLDQAFAMDTWAKGVAEKLGDQVAIFEATFNLGLVLNYQGKGAESVETTKRSLAIAQALNDKGRMGLALRLLGVTSDHMGDLDAALSHYNNAMTMFTEAGDKRGMASLYTNIGIAHDRQGKYSLALENLRKGLGLNEALGDKRGMSLAMANIGNIYKELNDYPEALFWYQKALAIFQEQKAQGAIATVYQNIAEIYRLQNVYPQSLEYYQKALMLHEEFGNKGGAAAALDSIGMLYSDQSDYRKSLEYFNKSLKIREEIGAKVGIAQTLHNLGKSHFYLGDYADALALDDRATAMAKAIGEPEIVWYSRTSAGMTLRALGQFEQAKQALSDAIATVEAMRAETFAGEEEQRMFFTDRIAPYQEMVGLLVAEKHTGEALLYAERGKGRMLLDVLQEGKVPITKAMTVEEREREGQLEAQLVALNKLVQRASSANMDLAEVAKLKQRLDDARLTYSDFRANLYIAHPELKIQRGQVQLITLEEAARLLPDKQTAILEFTVGERETQLFSLTTNENDASSSDLRAYPIGIKADDLEKRVKKFRQQVADRDLAFGAAARDLYDLLIKPAEAQLRGKKRLLIVPDLCLWDMPFQVLQPSRGHYVVEDFAMAYAPSLTVLREMTSLGRREKRLPHSDGPLLLAMANPVLGQETVKRASEADRNEALGPLPEAEQEVHSLERLYGAGATEVFTGAQAREDLFKAEAGKFRILHLATHGLLNDRSPMYSYVLLSQGGPDSHEDGMLEAWEIMRLDLQADFVVLSACETARGTIGAGEGVTGLAWAFFVAGVPTTVASQWKVESTSTSRLMLDFHEALKALEKRGVRFSAASALQQAETKLLHDKKYSHPFYWAGFVVVGDPQ
jgi:CHAT domain-containing protein